MIRSMRRAARNLRSYVLPARLASRLLPERRVLQIARASLASKFQCRRACYETAPAQRERRKIAFDLNATGRDIAPMSENGDHPRAFPRLELNAYVDYTGSEVLLYHRVQNISLGGVCIHGASVEDVGTLVDLVVNFPDLDASIALRGEVVWANKEAPMDMGIRYIDLDDDRKDTLKRYLSLLKSKAAGTFGTLADP